MFVADNLHKTVAEISGMSGDELVYWLAYFQEKQKRTDDQIKKQSRRR